MTINWLVNYIKLNPNIEVKMKPFDCGCSRGDYTKPCIAVDERETSKLLEWLPYLDLLTTKTFIGWKGGRFDFSENSELSLTISHEISIDDSELWAKFFE